MNELQFNHLIVTKACIIDYITMVHGLILVSVPPTFNACIPRGIRYTGIGGPIYSVLH